MAFISPIIAWLEDHPAIITSVFVGSIVLLVGSLWIGRRFLLSIPPDYFTRKHPPLEAWRNSHPALRWTLLISKNALGGLLIVLGLIMFLTPGQGILTLLLGIALVDVPGKQSVERWIISRPTVKRLVDRMRAHAGRPALVLSEKAESPA